MKKEMDKGFESENKSIMILPMVIMLMMVTMIIKANLIACYVPIGTKVLKKILSILYKLFIHNNLMCMCFIIAIL